MVRHLLCKPEDLSSNLGTHVKVEGETDSTGLFTDLHMYTHIYTHREKIIAKYFKSPNW